jgi:hypothetical protein
VNEQEALARMVAPGTPRPGKYRSGVIQVHVTRACDKSCYGCTQGSNLGGKTHFMSPEHFEQAVESLAGWWGVVGVFGGNPALSPFFETYCDLLSKYFPREQRGLWSNNPITPEKARKMAATFDPRVSNLNCHLDEDAFALFKTHWPGSMPFGLTQDSRHSPPYVALRDVLHKHCSRCCGFGRCTPEGRAYVEEGDPDFARMEVCSRCGGSGTHYDEGLAWELISRCPINLHWSAMLGVFRGQLRAWFCEIAGAQSVLHQDDPAYPDTGLDPTREYEVLVRPGERLERTLSRWWEIPMTAFAGQVRRHCHDCGVPLQGRGELAQQSDEVGREQVSETHRGVYRPKRKGRAVELVTTRAQLGTALDDMTKYLANAKE